MRIRNLPDHHWFESRRQYHGGLYLRCNPGSSVGDYVIVPTLVDPDNKLGNYNVVANNGTLTVLLRR